MSAIHSTTKSGKGKRLKIAISAAPEDDLHLEELTKCLVAAHKSILVWHEKMLEPGDKKEEESRHNLKNADVVLLLISVDFVNNPVCMVHVQWALENPKKMLVPVLLRPVDGWQELEFGAFQALPKSGLPLSEIPLEQNPYESVVSELLAGKLGAKLHVQWETGFADTSISDFLHLPPCLEAPLFVGEMIIDPKDPVNPGFILWNPTGQDISEDEKMALQIKLYHYLNAFLVVSGNHLHVNLSPYEDFCGIPEPLRKTHLGRDMLAQDLELKKYVAALTHPLSKTGHAFWTKIDSLLGKRPSFDANFRVWITAGNASVKESDHEGKLRVTLEKFGLDAFCETEYLPNAYLKKTKSTPHILSEPKVGQAVTDALKEIILPVIRREILAEPRFSLLRQIYSVMIMAEVIRRRMGEYLIGFMDTNDTARSMLDVVREEVPHRLKKEYLDIFENGIWQHTRKRFDTGENEVQYQTIVVGGIHFCEKLQIYSTFSRFE